MPRRSRSSTPSSPPPRLRTFPLFAALPRELQDLIFQYAISAYPARLLELTSNTLSTICTADNDVLDTEYSFTCSAPIPPLLHACKSSRELASVRWNLGFPSKMRVVKSLWVVTSDLYAAWGGDVDDEVIKRAVAAIEEGFEVIPRVWIDFETDALLVLEDESKLMEEVVSFGDFFFRIAAVERARVRNLVVARANIEEHDFLTTVFDGDVDGDMRKQIMSGLRKMFPGVRNLGVILDENSYAPRYLSQLSYIELPRIMGEDAIVLEAIRAAYIEELGDGVVKVQAVALPESSMEYILGSAEEA